MGHYSSKLCGDDCISINVFGNQCGVSWVFCKAPHAVRIERYTSTDILIFTVTVHAPKTGYAFESPLVGGEYVRVFIQNSPTSQFVEATIVDGGAVNCLLDVMPGINEFLVTLADFTDPSGPWTPCFDFLNGS
jgi:hypothetical protein